MFSGGPKTKMERNQGQLRKMYSKTSIKTKIWCRVITVNQFADMSSYGFFTTPCPVMKQMVTLISNFHQVPPLMLEVNYWGWKKWQYSCFSWGNTSRKEMKDTVISKTMFSKSNKGSNFKNVHKGNRLACIKIERFLFNLEFE